MESTPHDESHSRAFPDKMESKGKVRKRFGFYVGSSRDRKKVLNKTATINPDQTLESRMRFYFQGLADIYIAAGNGRYF